MSSLCTFGHLLVHIVAPWGRLQVPGVAAAVMRSEVIAVLDMLTPKYLIIVEHVRGIRYPGTPKYKKTNKTKENNTKTAPDRAVGGGGSAAGGRQAGFVLFSFVLFVFLYNWGTQVPNNAYLYDY